MARLLWLVLLCGCGDNLKGSLLPGAGESCLEEPCQRGLVCGHEGVCVEAGALGGTGEGDDCSASVECAHGLVCTSDNVCAIEGSDGTGTDGDSCASDDDCQAGHFCDEAGACVDIGIPWWEGGACPEDDLEGDFRVLFDVPDLPESGEVDFFGLPFPNDTRLDAFGRPDLSGFPSPGAETAVPGLLAAIEDGGVGWSTNPTVFFRFSRAHDLSTVSVDGGSATVHWASIDEDAEEYGELASLQYFTRQARGKYICQNWLAVSVYDGRPLEEGHTYAVWVTKGVTDEDGVTAVRDNGFKVALGDERPVDLTLARAYDVYGGFRDYIAREGIDAANIAGAAVFTTGYPSRGTRYFREVTDDEEILIEPTALVACDEGVTSPCDDGGARSCAAAEPGFTEVHGRLSLPRYRTDGGSVVFDESSLRPQVQDTEEVCFAMTVPDGEAPALGWPVAIYGADLGGSFRDAVTTGVAGALATEGVATVTLELPGHGERGAAYVDPADLDAWLGNQLQSAADPHALVRFVSEWSAVAADSPTGADLAFDTSNLWFVGLGEGASTGVNFLAWTLDVQGGVLGNPSGYQTHRFADEDHPVDIEHGLMASFADSALTRWHPMPSLLQQYFDPADPVNNGLGVVREPSTEAKHLLVMHGVEDAETPVVALHSALRALYIPTAGTVIDDYGQSTTTFPVYENVSTDDGRRTAATVQVAGDHDVLVGAEGLRRTAAFIASGLAGAPPNTF
ncbi:MAG: hypothetical protein Q8P41_32210 [Pseudomonadota bacterium]|nr:hypothetical protein [Pseudomonadota bacterium]